MHYVTKGFVLLTVVQAKCKIQLSHNLGVATFVSRRMVQGNIYLRIFCCPNTLMYNGTLPKDGFFPQIDFHSNSPPYLQTQIIITGSQYDLTLSSVSQQEEQIPSPNF